MAGTASGGKGGLGWLILAAALAVPGFLFYNWWSHLKAERDHAISAKASKRADGGVFQTPPPLAGRLVNPMAPSTGAPAGFAPAPGTASTSAPAGFAPATAMTPAAMSAPNPSALPMAGAAPAGTMPAALSTGAVSASPGAVVASTATIVLSRDPMMSPMDQVRLQEAVLAEEARLRALADANRPQAKRVVKKKVQPPIESKIELQGIVAKSDGDNLAIINGATVNPGESFTVDNYKGKVKVLKITSSEVTLDYNGRKIKLNVNVE